MLRIILMGVLLFAALLPVERLRAAGDGEGTSEVQSGENALYVDPATRDFSQNPKLLERILAGPHGYFRFINLPFSSAICSQCDKMLANAPSLNLHGDAHIEQYAVTDLGRGLTDYDDSSTGPGIIDLLRFGVSLRLACQANQWEAQADSLFLLFLNGYRQALQNPALTAPEPAIVQTFRAGFKHDRQAYFEWIAKIMLPMPEAEQRELLQALQPYIETKLLEDPTLTRDYFRVIRAGYLKMGIGSALDLKYLLRIRGASDDPLDDIVLECKEVRDLRGISCIQVSRDLDPFRILLGQTRIAYRPFHHLGYFRFKEHNFWVHSWVDNYQEVKINKSFRNVQQLAEVVYDVGVQLGLGHVRNIASPLDLQLRREQLRLLDEHQTGIIEASRHFTKLTIAAWEAFREAWQKQSHVSGGKTSPDS